MNKTIYSILLGLALCGMAACSNDDSLPDICPADRGTVTDDLGNEYEWVRIGDQMWTTSNAKNGTDLADAQYYNNYDYKYVLAYDEDVEYFESEYLPTYGNLMTLEDAINSAPDGWRLPTDEDWQKLERTLGMKNTDSKGFRGDGVADALLAKDSGAELGLDLGGGCFPKKSYGWIEVNLDYVGEHAYYWTATIAPEYEEDYSMAYFRRITANYGKVARECMRADSYLSVRWVKDVE